MTTALQVKSGGSWRAITGLFVKSGGSWRTIQNAWVKSGGVWQKFYATLVVALSAIDVQNSDVNVQNTATCRLNSDGTITLIGNLVATGPTNWATPTTVGVGSSYWMRWYVGGPVLSLATDQANVVTAEAEAGLIESTSTLAIYSDSGGTQLVASCTLHMSAYS